MKSWPFLLAAILLVLTVGISDAEKNGKKDGQGDETDINAIIQKGWNIVKELAESLWGQFTDLVKPAVEEALKTTENPHNQLIAQYANEKEKSEKQQKKPHL